MKRLEEAQANLITTYALYNAASEKSCPKLTQTIQKHSKFY
jgi:hypothetical protein